MTDYVFKTSDLLEEPVVTDRKVKAVIGRVGVVDYENEMIVGESFKIGPKIRTSRWIHNSMPLAKMRGLIDVIEEPVGYGAGMVDGDRIIGEVDVMKGARGDAFLEHIRAAGDALGWSHGFTVKRRETRGDGVELLHGAWTREMSPVPDPASPGTQTLASLLGMKIESSDVGVEQVVQRAVDDLLKSGDFEEYVRRAAQSAVFDLAWRRTVEAVKGDLPEEQLAAIDVDPVRGAFMRELLGAVKIEDVPEQSEETADDEVAEPETVAVKVLGQTSRTMVSMINARFGGGG